MKRYDIDARFTEFVTAYLVDGWMLNTKSMNGHQGEEGKVDLVKGDELIRIWISRESEFSFKKNNFHGNKMVLRVGRWNHPASYSINNTVWMKDLDVIAEKVFYEVSRDYDAWYVEDLEVALKSQEVRSQRYRNRYSPREEILMMEDAARYIARDYLKRKGYKRISWNDIVVHKYIYHKDETVSYSISYKNNSYILR